METKHKRPGRRNSSKIDPDCLYTRQGFLRDAGLSEQRLSQAKQLGVELERINLGRQQYVEGVAGIDFIKRFSAALKQAN